MRGAQAQKGAVTAMLESHEEQVEFRDWLREGMHRAAPLEHTRKIVEGGNRADPALWQSVVELTVPAMAIPEAYGGTDLGPVGMVIALQETGRVLLPTGHLTTGFVAPLVLLELDDAGALEQLLPQIASGTTRVAVADLDPGPGSVLTPVRASMGADGPTLTGTKTVVVDADVADELLVAVHDGEESSLFLASASAPGVRIASAPPLDTSRPALTVSFDAAPARPIGASGAARRAVELGRGLLALGVTAEASGALEACMNLAVEYAKIRVQFGRPIGQFQAIKHLCADMFVDTQASQAIVHDVAADWAATGRLDPRRALVAAAYVGEAFTRTASGTVQVHGGTGITWEQPTHLFLKRAKADQLLLGGVDAEIATLSEELFSA
jgi:alkylation response protein AidB-like acyl-CoA dehydrogenase